MDISVIVPTYNRAPQLAECLDALTQQDFPGDRFEVIVADDAGTQDLAGIVAAAGARLVRLTVNGGPGAARNAGAAVAIGKLLAFTDDDCLPEPGWLTALWRQHSNTPGALLGGRLVNALPENRCAEASQLISDLVYAHYNADPENAAFFSSNNMAVPREPFLAAGGFVPEFRVASEDRELCDRWRHNGSQLVLVTGAVVRHAHDLSLRKFVRQHFNYGRGACHYHRLREARGSGRMVQDMKFHATLPGNLKRQLRGVPMGRALAGIGLLGVWQVANAAGFFYEKCRGRV